MKQLFTFALVLLAALSLSACGGGIKKEVKYPTGADQADTEGDIYAESPSIFGEGGLGLFKGKDRDDEDEKGGTTGIGVNSYLWRASLDTVSFMPLASADPFGGVILTDWYSAPEASNERFKLNVFILSKHLRSDGIQVKLFRQTKQDGEWRDAKASQDTARKLEDTILTRARQMRVAKMGTFEE